MTIKQHLGVAGLATDPNRLAVQGDGALEIARECVVRRQGFIEPRPGFALENTEDASPLNDLKALIPFDGDVLHVGTDVTGDGDPFNAYWPIAEDVVRDGEDAALLWNDGSRRGVEARSNLYLTTADGVRRLMSSTDVDALMAGLIPPTLTTAQESPLVGVGDHIATTESVAYRAIFEVTLTNGLIIKSAPSGRVVYTNDAAGPRHAEVYVVGVLPDIPGATVKLKIYRSYSTTSPNPSDEMYLAVEHDVTGSAIDSPYDDRVPNQYLGEALYTNPKQEGVRRSNVRPPACKDLALYQGSLFYANITRQARQEISWVENSDATGVEDGVGARTYTGTRTNGSATITGLSSIVGLRPGMILATLGAWGGTLPVWIRTVAGSSATMSAAWGGATDGAPVSISFADALWILPEGEVGTIVTGDRVHCAGLASTLLSSINDSGGFLRTVTSEIAFGVGISDVSRVEGTTFVPGAGVSSILLEAFSATQNLYLMATHGDGYQPPLPEFNDVVIASVPPEITSVVAPLEVAPEHLPNYIGWSKDDEPEHHTLGAIEGVGHQKNPLARIWAARNALWIFKTADGDGLYRLSGFGERSGWRIDKIDTDSHLLCADLLTAHEDIVYMWSDKGMVAVSDAGPIPISRQLIGKDTRAIERWTTPATVGGFAVTNRKDHEVIFGLPAEPTEEAEGIAEVVYVWNIKTSAFTTWFYSNDESACCAAYANGLLLFGTTQSGWAQLEREDIRADAAYTLDIDDVDDAGSTILIAGGSGWAPAVGDAVDQSGDLRFVVEVISALQVVLNDVTGLTASAATAYAAYESVVAWTPKTAEGPSVLKRHTLVLTHWDSREGVGAWTLAFNSYIGTVNSGVQAYENDLDSNLALAADHRAMVTREYAMASRIIPGVYIRQAQSKWRLGGVTIMSEPIGVLGSVHR